MVVPNFLNSTELNTTYILFNYNIIFKNPQQYSGEVLKRCCDKTDIDS